MPDAARIPSGQATNRALLGAPLALAACLAAFAAAAQGAALQVTEGHRLAQQWCSGCHLVGPQQTQAPSDAVPSFAAIANMPSTTQRSLKMFLMSPHPPMPDLKLSSPEMDDLAAYILSQRKAP